MVTIADFRKLEIKIGEVVNVEPVENSRNLLKFTFDIGDSKRQVIAGMKPFFDDLTTLIGLKMPILLNIEPSCFVGLTSEGMIIAADDGHRPIFLIPKEDLKAGSIVK